MTMRDCPNAEMRDDLPLLASGRLTGAAREAVERHVDACAECAAELRVLAAVHAGYPVPVIDANRVAAGIAQTIRGTRPVRRTPYYQQPLWRVAAGMTLLIAGAAAAVLIGNGNPDALLGPEVAVVDTATPSTSVGSTVAGAPRAGEPAGVGFGIPLDDLTDAEVEALLASLDAIEGNVPADPQVFARPIVIETVTPEDGRN